MDNYRSGYWKLPKEKAAELVGGCLYLHKKQKEPSFFGGKILDYEMVPYGEGEELHVVFTFTPTREQKGVREWGKWSVGKLVKEDAVHFIHKEDVAMLKAVGG
jgi:hypothetical protein